MANKLFGFVDKAVDRVGYWHGLFVLVSSAFTWLSKQLAFLEPYGWPEAIFFGVGITCIVFMAMSALLVSWRYFRPLSQQPQASSADSNEALISALMERASVQEKPKPVFGRPRQHGNQPYLSWWQIPITIDVTGNSPPQEFRHCTVELFLSPFFGLPSGDPIKLRWLEDDRTKGVEEMVLVEGVERWVPIAVRCERQEVVDSEYQPYADGKARITGAAFLRDHQVDKFFLKPPAIDFRLRVKSGPREWESQHMYRLHVPRDPSHSNGTFILEIRPLPSQSPA